MSYGFGYTHALLKSRGLKTLSALQSLNINHSRLFSVALAHVLAHNLSLPQQQTEDIRGEYRMQHFIDVSAKVSAINELLPHNTKQTLEDVIAFYSMRYSAVFPAKIPLVFTADNAVNAFFGIKTNISDEILDTIQKNAERLTMVISNLALLLEDIEDSQQKNRTQYSSEASDGPLNTFA
jgi:hypothetical protein